MMAVNRAQISGPQRTNLWSNSNSQRPSLFTAIQLRIVYSKSGPLLKQSTAVTRLFKAPDFGNRNRAKNGPQCDVIPTVCNATLHSKKCSVTSHNSCLSFPEYLANFTLLYTAISRNVVGKKHKTAQTNFER